VVLIAVLKFQLEVYNLDNGSSEVEFPGFVLCHVYVLYFSFRESGLVYLYLPVLLFKLQCLPVLIVKRFQNKSPRTFEINA
jgi:hypothetical protein